ncbi:MAG TPA: PDDEXK nuclease domain-containing protein [Kofleriaceae bacterium]|nr:PDDEXK nuclease domain-containing protein [Kofleriaceae bacterium]
MVQRAKRQPSKQRLTDEGRPRVARPRAAQQASDEQLFERVAQILEQARGQIARTINTAMVQAYWLVGREIVEVEQAGEQRAGYGDELIQRLAARLTGIYGQGFSAPNLRRMRQFYLVFPKGSALPEIRSALPSKSGEGEIRSALPSNSAAAVFPSGLGWTHYVILMRVANPAARAFYEIEAVREAWSTRELERQIGALLFDRLAKHRDPEAVLALAHNGQEVATPADVIKDPFVLEFLDLGERADFHERDVEQAVIDRLEAFLLEMGKGFCFVARQKRLTIDGDHFYVDLVFYNRLLQCFVLVDLKLGKLTHQDLGQMMMYVNYFDRTQRAPHEAKTVGIVLCSEKNDAMVKITLPEDNDQIVAATYQMYLPTEAELRAEVTREREEAERMLRLATPPPGSGEGGDA